MLSVVYSVSHFYCFAACHYAECHYSEYHYVDLSGTYRGRGKDKYSPAKNLNSNSKQQRNIIVTHVNAS